MRGQRAKQYRKLMTNYGLNFGFREPYQVLMDANIIKDAARFKMDLAGGLEKALHGRVKPMVTQCSMRHLYKAEPPVPDVVELAKTYERRRCGHHNLDEPLDTLECLCSVIDPQRQRTNKHRYVVATQDAEVRKFLRTVKSVPLIYINRSVMILEPMAKATMDAKELEERRKLLTEATDAEIDAMSRKRKKAERRAARKAEAKAKADGLPWVEDLVGARMSGDEATAANPSGSADEEESRPKKKRKGPKGPNPLSVKKPKKRVEKGSRGGNSSPIKSVPMSVVLGAGAAEANGSS